jgi:hypothetical protein
VNTRKLSGFHGWTTPEIGCGTQRILSSRMTSKPQVNFLMADDLSRIAESLANWRTVLHADRTCGPNRVDRAVS